jgi:hypothetical protein
MTLTIPRIANILCLAATKKGLQRLTEGNCGQFAYALARFLHDRVSKTPKYKLCFISRMDSPEELLYSDYDLSHVYLTINKMAFDGYGKLTDFTPFLSLLGINGSDPEPYTICLDWNDPDALKIISGNTNYTRDWNFYYDFFEVVYPRLLKITHENNNKIVKTLSQVDFKFNPKDDNEDEEEEDEEDDDDN